MYTFEDIIALVTLTAMEIVLGIDNIVFIAILSGKLPPEQRAKARQIGLLGAMIMRILLLLGITWVMGLTKPLLTLWGIVFTGKDLVLLGGGLFLVAKATHEIHNKLEGPAPDGGPTRKPASLAVAIVQIMLMDIIFTLDSVITAVGMVEVTEDRPQWIPLSIMIAAVMIAVAVMMIFAKVISEFVERHPTVKMLALSFLLLIGVMLAADGLHQHISKGYIYAAMAFSLFVELLNLRLRKVSAPPVHLHQPRLPQQANGS
jgi:predicted tellurium resistance membrane protein TerC